MTVECLDCLQLCGISWLVHYIPQKGYRQQKESRFEIQTFNDSLEEKYQIGEAT